MKAKLLYAVALGLLVAAGGGARAAEAPVTAAAVWQPPADFLPSMHARCDGRGGDAFSDCFVAAMARAHASQAAIVFARRVQSDGYLAALSRAQPVAAALVVYPFRANENDAWFLVNGTPSLIDVDDQHILALDRMTAAPAYRALLARYPKASFWPGERGDRLPRPQPAATGGQRFTIGYQLHDLCHACAVIGRVRFAFDFDRAGKFLGTTLLAVTPTSR